MKSNYKNIDEANNKIDSIIKQFEICKEQIQKENEEQKKIIKDYRNQNFELREDIGTYKNQYNKLFDKLTLKTRQNSILSLEINELKRELKEYRGF